MKTTIDAAGRLVIPKELREELGLRQGPVEVTADGNALRVETIARGDLEHEDGRLVIPASGTPLTAAEVRAAVEAARR